VAPVLAAVRRAPGRRRRGARQPTARAEPEGGGRLHPRRRPLRPGHPL